MSGDPFGIEKADTTGYGDAWNRRKKAASEPLKAKVNANGHLDHSSWPRHLCPACKALKKVEKGLLKDIGIGGGAAAVGVAGAELAKPGIVSAPAGRLAGKAVRAVKLIGKSAFNIEDVEKGLLGPVLLGTAGLAAATAAPALIGAATRKRRAAAAAPPAAVTKSAFGVELGKAASDDDKERGDHYGRMSRNLGVLGGAAGTVGAGSLVVGQAERRGHDPMGFAERPGKKPLTPAGKLRVLKPFSEAHAYQAKTLGGLAAGAGALSAAYKLKQRKQQVGKSDRSRKAGDAALGAGSAAVGGSTLAFGMKNAHMLNGQANLAATEARGAHHLIAGTKVNGWKTPAADLASARRERTVGLRVLSVKKPAALLAGGAAAAGGATLLELGRHNRKPKTPVTKSAFGVER